MKPPFPSSSLALAIALLTTACNSPATTSQAGTADPATAAAASDTLVDPSSGTECAGKNLRITRNDVTVVVHGECGDVTITASGGTLNFDKARSIHVEGTRYTVINQEVGSVRVAGEGNVLNLTTAPRIEVSGSNNTILVTEADEVRFSGNDNTVNASSEPRVDDGGRGNRVI